MVRGRAIIVAVIGISMLTLVGCGTHHIKLQGPGCSMAIIPVGPTCYAREFADRTEVHCPNGTLIYRCITHKEVGK